MKKIIVLLLLVSFFKIGLAQGDRRFFSFSSRAREGAVYKWEPLLNCQFEAVNLTFSTSVLLSKTYYDYGKLKTKLHGSRGRKTHGFSNKLGFGATLLILENWKWIPFFQSHITYKIHPRINMVLDNRFYVDFKTKKYGWNPMWGIEYEWFGVNFGYTLVQKSEVLRSMDKFTAGVFIIIGYHKNRIVSRKHQSVREKKSLTQKNE